LVVMANGSNGPSLLGAMSPAGEYAAIDLTTALSP
jgi:hypothetical protein